MLNVGVRAHVERSADMVDKSRRLADGAADAAESLLWLGFLPDV
jgi:hypothetical protein